MRKTELKETLRRLYTENPDEYQTVYKAIRTLSSVGRVFFPSGASIFRPRAVPAIIRIFRSRQFSCSGCRAAFLRARRALFSRRLRIFLFSSIWVWIFVRMFFPFRKPVP